LADRSVNGLLTHFVIKAKWEALLLTRSVTVMVLFAIAAGELAFSEPVVVLFAITAG
jgi:hypothetical protein